MVWMDEQEHRIWMQAVESVLASLPVYDEYWTRNHLLLFAEERLVIQGPRRKS